MMERLERILAHVLMVIAVGFLLLTVAITAAPANPEEAPTLPFPYPPVVYIHDSPGGVVREYIKVREELREQGVKVRISGYCASACTLFLDLPDVCVEPTARLGFHAPYITVLPGMLLWFDSLTQSFLQFYPEPIRAWIVANGGLPRMGVIWLEGEEMARIVTLCDPEVPTS